jgi:hypothetical protein
MNKQEIFDRVVDRLHDGKGRASSEHACTYYCADTQNVCALGALLECPSDYETVYGGIKQLLVYYKSWLVVGGVIPEPVLDAAIADAQFTDFLDLLQGVHDKPVNWDGCDFVGYKDLAYVAEKYHVEFTPRKGPA